MKRARVVLKANPIEERFVLCVEVPDTEEV